MAAILHTLDQRRLIDTNGIADDAEIYFYATGGLTPAPVYTTAALSVEHSHPITVASGAAVPDIYLDSTVTYRRRIVYSDGSVDDTDPYMAGAVVASELASTATGKGAELVGSDDGASGSLWTTVKGFIAYLRSSAGSSIVNFLQAGTGATSRSVQAKLRDVVSVKDFGAVGDGVTDDTAAIQAALDTGKDVFFPGGYTFKTASALTPVSGQTLFSKGRGATISGNFNGYLFSLLGSAGAAISSVSAPIAALTWEITMVSSAGLAAGDAIVMHDIVADEYEVNRIQYISGNTLYTTWPITQPFATAANIRLYKMTAVSNVRIRGLSLTNTHASGGLVTATYTSGCAVEDCLLGPCGYIGATFAISLWPSIVGNEGDTIGSSASAGSGCGFRVTKAGRIKGNRFNNQRADESITLYRNNSHAIISGNRIAQYIFAHADDGAAGNAILLDQRNYWNTISGNTIVGSATYAIYLHSSSSYNSVIGNTIDRANLGAIKVESTSNGNTIDNNIISNIIDATDANEGGAASAGIRVKSDCSDNRIGKGNIIVGAAGLAIVNAQSTNATSFQGARVKKAADQTLVDYTGAPVIAWDGEDFDTSSFHNNATDNSRFTIPGSDVLWVQLGCMIGMSLVGNPAIYALTLKKNGSTTFAGSVETAGFTEANSNPTVSAVSGPIAVSPGDYFEWQFYCDDNSITVVAARSNAWIQVLA